MPLWQLEKGIHAGEILKIHGYLGAVRVAFLFPGLSKKLKPGSSIFIEWMQKPVPYTVTHVQWTSEDSAIMNLSDVRSSEEAGKLVGRRIILSELSLPRQKKSTDPGDVLIGYTVLDEAGNQLGEVIEFYDTGGQNLLEVKHATGEFLMPYHADFIIKENKRQKRLTVRLPEGMADLSRSESA